MVLWKFVKRVTSRFLSREQPVIFLLLLPVATGAGAFLGSVCAVAISGVHADATTAMWVRTIEYVALAILLIASPLLELLTLVLLLLLLCRLIVAVLHWIGRSTKDDQDLLVGTLDGVRGPVRIFTIDPPMPLEPPKAKGRSNTKTPGVISGE